VGNFRAQLWGRSRDRCHEEQDQARSTAVRGTFVFPSVARIERQTEAQHAGSPSALNEKQRLLVAQGSTELSDGADATSAVIRSSEQRSERRDLRDRRTDVARAARRDLLIKCGQLGGAGAATGGGVTLGHEGAEQLAVLAGGAGGDNEHGPSVLRPVSSDIVDAPRLRVLSCPARVEALVQRADVARTTRRAAGVRDVNDPPRVRLMGIDGRTDADTQGAVLAALIDDDELDASDIEVQARTRCSAAPVGTESLPEHGLISRDCLSAHVAGSTPPAASSSVASWPPEPTEVRQRFSQAAGAAARSTRCTVTSVPAFAPSLVLIARCADLGGRDAQRLSCA
jgi:osmotically-inducible protein OsmY